MTIEGNRITSVVIADFGIAHDSEVTSRTFVGSNAWISPELWKSLRSSSAEEKKYDAAKADGKINFLLTLLHQEINHNQVWGLGLLLYSLLTLNPPYTGIRDFERYISKGIRPSLKLYPEIIANYKEQPLWASLQSTFKQCTQENPQERPEVKTILEQLQAIK